MVNLYKQYNRKFNDIFRKYFYHSIEYICVWASETETEIKKHRNDEVDCFFQCRWWFCVRTRHSHFTCVDFLSAIQSRISIVTTPSLLLSSSSSFKRDTKSRLHDNHANINTDTRSALVLFVGLSNNRFIGCIFLMFCFVAKSVTAKMNHISIFALILYVYVCVWLSSYQSKCNN